MTTGVYKIKCMKNGKVYIGSSAWSTRLRLRAHRNLLRRGKHYSPYLQRSWNLYGEEAFEFITVEECAASKCLKREQYWLDKTKAYSPRFGFNTCRHAHSTAGREVKSETRTKIAAKLRGRKLPASQVALMVASRAGYRHSKETRAKIGAGHLGYRLSNESRAKISATKLAKSKLTVDQVESIRQRFITGHPHHGQNAMAREFGVSRCMIQKILKGTTWRSSRYQSL